MPIIETEIWKKNPDRPGTIVFDQQRIAEDIFNELEAHLEADGRLPDEYFLFDAHTWKASALFPRDGEILCYTNYGGSEGIYLDISVRYEKEVAEFNGVTFATENVKRMVTERFATGKTLGDSIDDLDRMHLVASSVTAAFYGNSAEIQERYAQIKRGDIEPEYPRPPQDKSPQIAIATSDQEFENKMAELLPNADVEGIRKLITYAKELEESGTTTKSEFFNDTFVELYLVTQGYGEETAGQILDVCKSFALNPFEIRGAAHHLQNGVEQSKIGQLAADGACDPPNGEPLSTSEALHAFESGTLYNRHTNNQSEAHRPPEAPEPGALKQKQSLANRLQAAGEKVKAQDAQNNDAPVNGKKGKKDAR